MQSGTIAFAGQHRASGRFGGRVHSPLSVDIENTAIALDSRHSEIVSYDNLTE